MNLRDIIILSICLFLLTYCGYNLIDFMFPKPDLTNQTFLLYCNGLANGTDIIQKLALFGVVFFGTAGYIFSGFAARISRIPLGAGFIINTGFLGMCIYLYLSPLHDCGLI